MLEKRGVYLVLPMLLVAAQAVNGRGYPLADQAEECPRVKSLRNFQLSKLLGRWYVLQYFASSEEVPEYRCMRSELSLGSAASLEITMNFTFSFVGDPYGEQMLGNITWVLPDISQPAHWVHKEDTYEGVYNTYVLDSDYDSWALLLHCAEKSGSPRYLSSFILTRNPTLPANLAAYLRDKLRRYDIDLDYMFPMEQEGCDTGTPSTPVLPPGFSTLVPPVERKKPLQHHHTSFKTERNTAF